MTNNTSVSNSMTEQKGGDQVFMFIKNLERFANEILVNKLLWTPEVLAFFGVKEPSLLKDFETAREEF